MLKASTGACGSSSSNAGARRAPEIANRRWLPRDASGPRNSNESEARNCSLFTRGSLPPSRRPPHAGPPATGWTTAGSKAPGCDVEQAVAEVRRIHAHLELDERAALGPGQQPTRVHAGVLATHLDLPQVVAPLDQEVRLRLSHRPTRHLRVEVSLLEALTTNLDHARPPLRVMPRVADEVPDALSTGGVEMRLMAVGRHAESIPHRRRTARCSLGAGRRPALRTGKRPRAEVERLALAVGPPVVVQDATGADDHGDRPGGGGGFELPSAIGLSRATALVGGAGGAGAAAWSRRGARQRELGRVGVTVRRDHDHVVVARARGDASARRRR